MALTSSHPIQNSSTTQIGAAFALVGALVPQVSEAAVVTVGGDGATGTGTLSFFGSADIGGLLANPLRNFSAGVVGGNKQYLYFQGALGQRIGSAYRSNIATTPPNTPGGGGDVPAYFTFINDPAPNSQNASLGSSDNWVPGHFRLTNGVNGGNPVFGWLHLGLPTTPVAGGPASAVTIHSFTYDNAANGAPSAFEKPMGGFAVPEPSSASLLALGAAGVIAHRRRKKATK